MCHIVKHVKRYRIIKVRELGDDLKHPAFNPDKDNIKVMVVTQIIYIKCTK